MLKKERSERSSDRGSRDGRIDRMRPGSRVARGCATADRGLEPADTLMGINVPAEVLKRRPEGLNARAARRKSKEPESSAEFTLLLL